MRYLQKYKLFENVMQIKSLKKELKAAEDWYEKNNYSSPKWKNNYAELDILRDKQEKKCADLRKKLFDLTGDYYGITTKEKNKLQIKPKGLESNYDNPIEVPKSVYRWISKNNSLLYSDATDAVRWYRIINSKDEKRYPSGNITIYRAVEDRNYNDIRPGDWVTTEIEYANTHNKKYFNGKGKIISMTVDGRDVLISPTGDYEEAIYAPLKYSLDIKFR